jgi:hypothetical protein
VVERLHLTGLRGDQPGRAPRALDGFPRLGQLDLLDAFGGHEERDLLSVKAPFGHGAPPSCRLAVR